MSSATATTNRFNIWVSAMRPRTLPLAIASIIMGTGLAAADGSFDWLVALLCVLTAILLQILSNLANDYGDSLHGADHAERQGPKRAVQSGHVSPAAMRRAIGLAALLSVVSGLALLWLAFGAGAFSSTVIFIVLGAAAIGAAITYTAGKMPYGYAGFGDLAVLIFFGWVGVIGSYFVQTGRFTPSLLLPATACGLLAVAVLNVNNIRDMDSDRLAGKRSLPVRLGLRRARRYHWALLVSATLLAAVYCLIHFTSLWQFLFLLATPALYRNGAAISRTDALPTLNPWLKQMSLAALLFVILFSAGQILAAVL
ncbi:1,4-dihydroxy-2-naphthoate octaprenyltransferase [Candidatus Promineifilum breve]|uniref:1,4-dihydroxy-2-naphthoate octaprenyltransferase n=1 Tax=Candidatus Promineifilum breve TaxID=1806508 RepID=A0A170PE15_9CHLR|nr:1,4-dihydroxy-2-naphthoate polyprenyltransferase [Candidatus Promineifilum breve]CUS02317.2 1,4-dihydroxy-2-naphthoate octaprenyltransferase [Candidatus Promineifilum breve]